MDSKSQKTTSEIVTSDARDLTSRERFVRALRCQPADRVPAWMMRQAGRYLPEYHEVRRHYDFLTLCKTPEAAAEVSIQPLEAIGTEAIVIFNDIMLPLEHAGAKVEFGDHGPVIHNPIRSLDDLTGLDDRPIEPEEPVTKTIREVRRRVGDDIPIIGFIGAPWTLAAYWVEGRMSRQLDAMGALRWGDPALLEALLEHITPIATEYLRIQIQAGADAVQIFDTWAGTLDPGAWWPLAGQYTARVIEALRPCDVPVIVYINGAAPYLDQLGRLGADAISLDWRVELAHARKALGPNVALQGNLDPRALLAGPEATEKAVREIFDKYPAGPGHVFNLGHGVLPATPVASARKLMEAVKYYGEY